MTCLEDIWLNVLEVTTLLEDKYPLSTLFGSFQFRVYSADRVGKLLDAVNIEDCSLNTNYTNWSHPAYSTTVETTTIYNACARRPCINGICQTVLGHQDYSCTCEYGYVGRNCEKVLKQCELLTPCKNGGSCSDFHGLYKCDCRLGYDGTNCEKCWY